MDTHNDVSEKVHENRLRRMAQRQGLHLVKSRRRDTRALDYGGWAIVNENNFVETGDVPTLYWMTLADVEKYLSGGGS